MISRLNHAGLESLCDSLSTTVLQIEILNFMDYVWFGNID